MFDFRNDTLVEWFGREYIGGDMCVGSPLVDGFFADDAYGLGAPDSPDHSPVVNISQLTPQDVEKWNEGQLKALILAQNLAVKDYNAWNWQNMEPMCIPGHDDPCPNGWVGMNAPNQKSCLNGGADQAHGKGFAGLRALCTDKEGGERARNIPWLMHIWNNKIAEEGRFPGQGSCTESGDCEHDTCEADGGGVHCASSITDIRQRIAAFLLARGEYAWMGYNWMGCAGSDHSRGGFVDGARWQRPSEWDPLGAMKLDFGNGGKPLDPICREVSDGIFERRFEKIVVRLDCNEWKASFLARNDTTRSSA
uniref:Uncharacterized protein n=2 Tax=Lotharella globosa TaxID=91324 RepID=A0A6V3L060_9EUKA